MRRCHSEDAAGDAGGTADLGTRRCGYSVEKGGSVGVEDEGEMHQGARKTWPGHLWLEKAN